MIRMMVAGALLCAIGLARPALAAELLAGVYAHDVTYIGKLVGSGAAGREHGADVQLGLRSERIESLSLIGRPQAHAFVSINTDRTSDFIAAGLSWPIALGERVYLRPGLGLAYTNGKAGLPPANAPGLSPAETQRRLHLYNHRIDFGSKVLFEPEIGLGARLTDRLSVELSWTHISNGEIFHRGKNQGLDDTGVRLVYSLRPLGR